MAERRAADSSDEEEQTIAADVVVTKYKMAGDIVNRAMALLVKECVPGTTARTLCERGDAYIEEEASKVYKKEKEMKKGIAFPSCVSVNHCICCFSPLRSEPDVTLADSDVVKIELGAHIDGFIAQAGHTVVLGSSPAAKVTGRKADVLQACYVASEIAHRLLKPGGSAEALSGAVQKVAEAFGCKPIEGGQSFEMKRNEICAEKSIMIGHAEGAKKVSDKTEFAMHEVYALSISLTTGEGKPRQLDTRTTVHRRLEGQYSLKMKASRIFLSELDKKFGLMPFTLRAFEDEKKARMGVVECVKHGLLEPYNVLYEKDGEFVAHVRFTVLLMQNGAMRITNNLFDPDTMQSDRKLEDADLLALLATSTSLKAQKKKKKKAATAAAEAAKPEADE